jgi:DNA polymerase-3 subunit delta'
MRAFIKARALDEPERRLALAEGAPGLAVSIDLEAYDRRRTAMLALLKVAGGLSGFDTWLKHADSVAARRTEKLESYLEVLYSLLEDIVLLVHASSKALRNNDIRGDLEALARRVDFEWLRRAIGRVDELVELGRRNIQKSIAFDAFAASLRTH